MHKCARSQAASFTITATNPAIGAGVESNPRRLSHSQGAQPLYYQSSDKVFFSADLDNLDPRHE